MKLIFIPKEICVSTQINEKNLYEDFLTKIKGTKVYIRYPVRGEKAQLIDTALQNAVKELDDRLATGAALENTLSRLQHKLKLDKVPVKIECFDNSNISGSQPVGGMVVFLNGLPEKSLYRKFKIKTVHEHDDYAYMKEALTRRYGKKEIDAEPEGSLPDLLIVDGGKGQLNIAVSVLNEINIDHRFNIIGIAKKDENKGETDDKIFVPNRSNPINFGKDRDLLMFLQRIRDEAHRFAIAYHRKRRSKAIIRSVLDDIKGIGNKRKSILLNKYGGVGPIKSASIEELSRLPGMNLKVALNLKKHLNSIS